MNKYNNIVVLTGAGISAESGIKTFRDNDRLWENYRVEDVATPEAFARDPELVYRFYNLRRQQLLSPDLAPNNGHRALAEFAKQFPGKFTIVTQNVDNLHERAGSGRVIHMHGELLAERCLVSGQVTYSERDYDDESQCQCCERPAKVRPHIVWFGEMPLYMDDIFRLLSEADLFVSIGTSGNVYPAAGFVAEARGYGAHTVELNLEPSNVENDFAEHHYGPASTVVAEFFNRLI